MSEVRRRRRTAVEAAPPDRSLLELNLVHYATIDPDFAHNLPQGFDPDAHIRGELARDAVKAAAAACRAENGRSLWAPVLDEALVELLVSVRGYRRAAVRKFLAASFAAPCGGCYYPTTTGVAELLMTPEELNP